MLYVAGCWLLSVCFELFVEWWTGELGSQVVTVQRIFHAAGMARCWLLAVVGFWTCACKFLDTQTRHCWSSLDFWGLGHASATRTGTDDLSIQTGPLRVSRYERKLPIL